MPELEVKIKALPMKRALSEDTRLQTITLRSQGVFDLHRGLGDDLNYYITKHGDPDQIYAAFTQEMWNIIFGE